MKEPWYRIRFSTLIVMGLALAAFLFMNSRSRSDGVVCVYLDEGETLCVAYAVTVRGWPETYEVKYTFDDEHTTILGHPKRKFVEDEFYSPVLLRNLLLAASILVGVASLAEVIARLIPPRKPTSEPTRQIRGRLISTQSDLPKQA
jgi:hypothetical protein